MHRTIPRTSLLLLALLALPCSGRAAAQRFDIDLRELDEQKRAPVVKVSSNSPAAGKAKTAGRRAANKKGSARSSDYLRYTVKPGDTIYKILMGRLGMTEDEAERLIPEISRINKITNIRKLRVGQTLLIPVQAKGKKTVTPQSAAGPPSAPTAPAPGAPGAPAPPAPGSGAPAPTAPGPASVGTVPAPATAAPAGQGAAPQQGAAPEEPAGEKAEPEGVAPEQAQPEEEVPDQAEPEKGEAEQGEAETPPSPGGAGKAEPGKAQPERPQSEEEAPETAETGNAPPGNAAPATAPPGTVSRESATPGAAASGSAAPETAASGAAAPATAVPGSVSPESAAPGTAATPIAPVIAPPLVCSIPDKDPAKIVETVLNALSITSTANKVIESEEGAAEPYGVKVDRYFEYKGGRYIVSIGDTDPYNYTLIRLLEKAGYRVLVLGAVEEFTAVTEKVLRLVGIPYDYGRHLLPGVNQATGYLVQQGAVAGGRRVLITRDQVDSRQQWVMKPGCLSR